MRVPSAPFQDADQGPGNGLAFVEGARAVLKVAETGQGEYDDDLSIGRLVLEGLGVIGTAPGVV